jgi:hypothetical protein
LTPDRRWRSASSPDQRRASWSPIALRAHAWSRPSTTFRWPGSSTSQTRSQDGAVHLRRRRNRQGAVADRSRRRRIRGHQSRIARGLRPAPTVGWPACGGQTDVSRKVRDLMVLACGRARDRGPRLPTGRTYPRTYAPMRAEPGYVRPVPCRPYRAIAIIGASQKRPAVRETAASRRSAFA